MPEIIRQGDWGYGDTKGLAKAVDVGYRKWLKKEWVGTRRLRRQEQQGEFFLRKED